MKHSLLPLVALTALVAVAPVGAQTPPAAPAVVVTFSSWRVVPSPATSIVANIFRHHVGHFAGCDATGIPGTVSLRMATDANGQVSTSTVRASSFAAPNQSVTSCVVGASRSLRFPGSVQGTLDIEVVVNFAPPPAAPAPTR